LTVATVLSGTWHRIQVIGDVIIHFSRSLHSRRVCNVTSVCGYNY